MTVPLELLSRGPSRPDLLEDLVVADGPDGSPLVATLARWSAPAPVAVDPDRDTGLPPADTVEATLAGDTAAVIDVAPGLVGPGPAADRLAEVLIVAAHSGVGFGCGLVPRCADAGAVWALLSGAVAAMTGADVRAAVAQPDPARIVGLSRSAREAIRDVVTCVLVPPDSAGAIIAELESVPGRRD